jgi:molybdopterin-containing oxidoreductase family iron-sulfur binding subunit
MSTENRHINFALMKQYILDQQEAESGWGEEGKQYWRSLDELADSPVMREFVRREFPENAAEWDDPIRRRTFLKLMGASLALAGLSGCVYQPPEKIVPYVKHPEDIVPGKALFFATAFTLGGVGVPLLARANEGRPTKVEGNPDHPNNRIGDNDRGSSATDIFSQASILTLYDPDRSQTSLYRDETRPWTTFVGELRTTLDEQRAKQGKGIRFLTEVITSPTLAAQMKAILTEFPQAKWHQYEPMNDDNARAGAVAAFGQPVNTIYNFGAADRILAIDSDFLSCGPGSLRYAREFAVKRQAGEHGKGMNRLYCIESTPTTTGAKADHCWNVRPSEIESVARAIAQQLGANAPASNAASKVDLGFVAPLVKDLQGHKGASIVIAGREASPAVQALAHAMNSALGNVGKTVFYTDPLDANPIDQRQSLQDLINDIEGGRVELLVIVGGNPVYNTPIDLKLNQERMFKVKTRIHLSMYRDETSALSHWHIPETHYLETWSDTRSYDGTVSIVQPLIEPLYQSKSAHEFLAAFTPQYDRKSYEIVREYWQTQGQRQAQASATATGTTAPASATAAAPPATPQPTQAVSPTADFETSWRKWVHDGFIPNTALPVRTLTANAAAPGTAATPAQPSAGNFEILFRVDPTIYDGRFANNGWLQELPKPLTKITWDNAALVSPNTAKQLGLEHKIGEMGGDIDVDTVKITYQGRTLNSVPAWVVPGQPDNVITLHLGYGRWLAGRVGNDQGFNAYALRTAASPWFGTGAQVTKDTARHQVAATQLHFMMEGRDIVRSHDVGEQAHENGEVGHEPSTDETLYDPGIYDYKKQGMGYAWGMAIDLNNCVGCNACTIACQSENNIPVVGKAEVARSREMHWIRVDTYFKGNDSSHPESTHFMPVPCMHCENAPCEPVCPVHATVHSSEGLNDMVYNRCVGTKYCSNNCPYKVRRFNFFLYQDWDTPTYQLMRNPEVSVRSRGVMEKCTYCVQRIQEAKITSEIEGRKVRDGEIVTACQAVCPTEAIVFGDVNDPNSRVSKIKANERNYSLLAELNTRPRTTYLSDMRNPNPEISQQA